MFGRGFLVAPKVWPFVGGYEITLPKGDWIDYWTGERQAGGRKVKIDPPLDTLPVYVRAGTIIPEQPLVQNTDETPKGPLELKIYPGPDCAGNLYMDDGNTFAYKKGEFLRTQFTCENAAGQTKVHIGASEGTYRPWFMDVRLTIFATDKVRDVTLDGKSIKAWKAERGTVVISDVPWTSSAHDIEILYNNR